MRIVMQITFANVVRLFPAEAGLAITRRSIILRLTGLVRLETRVRIADDASVDSSKRKNNILSYRSTCASVDCLLPERCRRGGAADEGGRGWALLLRGARLLVARSRGCGSLRRRVHRFRISETEAVTRVHLLPSESTGNEFNRTLLCQLLPETECWPSAERQVPARWRSPSGTG